MIAHLRDPEGARGSNHGSSRSAARPHPWRFVDTGAGEPAANMALDEALLDRASGWLAPVIRFYGWAVPAATFGYFQKYEDVERLTPLRPLIRRTTGGGLVPHASDWTYSIVFPPGTEWYGIKARASYERLHRWVQRAFEACGATTELSRRSRPEGPGQCFVGAEEADVLWRGEKVAGAAQRRAQTGLLIQGSIQPQPTGVSREHWQEAMRAVASQDWKIGWEAWSLTDEIKALAAALAERKYSSENHNRRR